jgi:competence protein ComEC
VSWRYTIDRGRQWLSQQLATQLHGREMTAGLIPALSVGDRRGIGSDTWAVLRTTGTAHLLAISGMHIGLLAGLVYWLTCRLWRAMGGRFLLWLPAPRAGAIMASLAALLYAAMAGFSIPTQRALVMLLVVMLAVWRLRPLQPGRTLAWALLVVLLLDPLAVLSAGFWLSFGAVALILYAMTGQLGRAARPLQWLRIQLWITLGLLPLMLLLFQQISLVAPLANLVAIPVISLLVVPLVLVASICSLFAPVAAGGLLSLVSSLLEWLMQWLGALADWPLSHLQPVIPDGGSLLLLMAGILLLLVPRGLPGRVLAPVLLLPALLGQFPRPAPGQAWLTLLDVGQGLSAVVQTRSHLLVFDTGPRFSSGFDTGRAVLVPWLQQAGYRRIDVLVMSHGDNDHIGGLRSVLARYPVTRLYTSVPGQILAEQVMLCQAGQQWQWDGVRFEILGPSGPMASENDAACVLRIVAGNQAALLPADIEKAGELKLLQQEAEKLPAVMLVAPHHGSLTSSTPAFVRAVHPKYVLYPVGYHNRYRFPRPEVVQRYARLGAGQYLSQEQGALKVVLGTDGGLCKPISYRRSVRRYWHSEPKTLYAAQ